MKKKVYLFAAAFIALFVTSCSNNPDSNEAVYDNAAPTDLSDIIEIYEKYKDKDFPDSVYNELLNYNDSADYVVFGDESYAIDLPQYNNSENKYLANAEWFFNACAFTFNIWSNQELFIRGIDDGTIYSTTDNISSKCIKNDTIRACADEYKKNMVNMMKNNESGNHELLDESYGYLEVIKTEIEGSMYQFADSIEIIYNAIDTMRADMEKRTEATFKKYIEAPENERLTIMLSAMNSCKTFDDQCSLLINWADCKESIEEDKWIIAVSERLVNSGKYNPRLESIWALWRSMKQSYCYGLSRDSLIPNDEFNEMRKKCYIATLKHVEKHPGDILAMVCAANIAGRYNMNRFGRFYLGNESSVEMMELMPERYEDIFNKGDGEENSEEANDN